MNVQITGALFKQMMLHGAAAITLHKQSINDLNVFPVPDGDTGTNMSLTIQTAASELRAVEPESIDKAASVTASALLRGARGNSGVILSLLFRGLSKSLKGKATASACEFAAAMQEGVAAAYSAVMKPAEGTVLTVSRLAADRAMRAAEETDDVDTVLESAIEQGYETLAETVEMNPVLKKAGVVDAGGKGYLLILQGMLNALRGEPLPEVDEDSQTQSKADFASLTDEDITFTYDTVFIVRKTTNKSIEPLRAYLDSIGDSLVIGEDDDAFKVHVHTDIPGEVLTEAQKYGTLEIGKIENMRLQYEDMAAGRKTKSADDLEGDDHDGESAVEGKKVGFIAVCAGDGLA
ncbi:MAG: DAK2 domain-containing protein, partial [Oscillospiraceae bacterium]|nr:DAK2 domain-containing protein [Oscillospiraceae bacterium]